MANILKLKEGQILYEVRKVRTYAGKIKEVFPVEVITINSDHIITYWNNNKKFTRAFHIDAIKKLRLKEPR